MSSASASLRQASKPVGARSSMIHGRSRSGFTLVELLVVIAIIGVLAGMTVGAAIVVQGTAKRAAITMDLKQLEMACQAYKEKFGEYPPDGTDPAAVARHLRKAFPRANVTFTSGLTPANALTFWLGGVWDDVNKKFIGFSADPTNPFDAANPSRIGPFFDFDLNRLGASENVVLSTGTYFAFPYWPQGISEKNPAGSIVYFRSENGNYTADGAKPAENLTNVKNYSRLVWPAVDMRQPNTLTGTAPVCVWVNPRGIQIFSAGLDVTYGNLKDLVSGKGAVLQYPDGTNYAPETMDDITNFSGGKLESAIP